MGKIEQKMREILKSWEEFKEYEVSADEAKQVFANNPYKLELISELADSAQASPVKEKITLYYSGPKKDAPSLPEIKANSQKLSANSFLDLCRGGHIENPSKDIEKGSWKLSRVAGAYWRGDEKNKMLTRIYGLAFENDTELKTYETRIEEAKKRDHKKLGKDLDLFVFSDLVGAGLPMWTPKGTILRNLLDDFVWKLRNEHGYVKVEIPHITKKDLYEKSGHWEKYKDDLFKITTREGHEFAMKPMNCPHHTQIYARKLWSYKELPQRYANTTTCYRDEQTGELSGLSRVRAFAQDDAHVFCRMDQVKEECDKIWQIVHSFYPTFGFELKVRLSLHDPEHPEKYLGDKDRWHKAENMLKEILEEKKVPSILGIGEAAFYGPKLDFMAEDAIGRTWQVATIQLDMNMPERFDLYCINEKGEKERIVMIHAAIMGSIERFLSILIEHTSGNFPLWLAPVQVEVIPVMEKHNEEALRIHKLLLEKGIRSKLSNGDIGFGKKVREAKEQKAPYFVILGDKDIAENKVTLESRDKGNLGQVSLEELLAKLDKENRDRH